MTFRRVDARPTAVIQASTTWAAFPRLWPELSGEVWACLRAEGVDRACPNVMLYRRTDEGVDVEVGVELTRPCRLTGRVVGSTLPAGEVATTVHRGAYADLGATYDALVRSCEQAGRSRTAVSWEVYGPHQEDPAELTTEIFWLLDS